MRKFLLSIGVFQTKTIKKLGFESYKLNRLNPYNPFSYILIAITLVLSLFWMGIKGIIENWRNPFKWQ